MRHGLLLVLLGVPAFGGAQVPMISEGTRVRVERPATKKVDGILMSQTADSMQIAAPQATMIASESISRIRESAGRSHARGAAKGAKIGAVVVGGGFALIVIGAYVSSSDANKSGLGEWLAIGAIIGGVEGAVLGGLIGALAGAERWRTIYSSPVRLTIRPPASGATGAGLSFAF